MRPGFANVYIREDVLKCLSRQVYLLDMTLKCALKVPSDSTVAPEGPNRGIIDFPLIRNERNLDTLLRSQHTQLKWKETFGVPLR